MTNNDLLLRKMLDALESTDPKYIELLLDEAKALGVVPTKVGSMARAGRTTLVAAALSTHLATQKVR